MGDLVDHELHGIGRFVGVVTLTVDGAPRDYLHLVYAGDVYKRQLLPQRTSFRKF